MFQEISSFLSFLELIGCLHDQANVQQTSSKRPASHVYFEYICWKFAGRLLDRVNTLSVGLHLKHDNYAITSDPFRRL